MRAREVSLSLFGRYSHAFARAQTAAPVHRWVRRDLAAGKIWHLHFRSLRYHITHLHPILRVSLRTARVQSGARTAPEKRRGLMPTKSSLELSAINSATPRFQAWAIRRKALSSNTGPSQQSFRNPDPAAGAEAGQDDRDEGADGLGRPRLRQRADRSSAQSEGIADKVIPRVGRPAPKRRQPGTGAAATGGEPATGASATSNDASP